jgi:hypothetical protein
MIQGQEKAELFLYRTCCPSSLGSKDSGARSGSHSVTPVLLELLNSYY